MTLRRSRLRGALGARRKSVARTTMATKSGRRRRNGLFNSRVPPVRRGPSPSKIAPPRPASNETTGLAENAPRDDHSLDLARSFVDAGDAHVPHLASHRE